MFLALTNIKSDDKVSSLFSLKFLESSAADLLIAVNNSWGLFSFMFDVLSVLNAIPPSAATPSKASPLNKIVPISGSKNP